MHEDLIKEINEDKKMGLELSDTAYYNVDDGVTDEPLFEGRNGNSRRRQKV